MCHTRHSPGSEHAYPGTAVFIQLYGRTDCTAVLVGRSSSASTAVAVNSSILALARWHERHGEIYQDHLQNPCLKIRNRENGQNSAIDYNISYGRVIEIMHFSRTFFFGHAHLRAFSSRILLQLYYLVARSS